jgi:hypothetical protein
MQTRVIAALALLVLRGASAHATTGPGPFTPGPLRADTPSLAFQAGDGEQRGVDVRVWTEDERDAFAAGDRTRVFVRTNAGAYVAVLHIDTSGNLEVLFPASPFEDGFLQARRLYSLPTGYSRYWTVRGAPGLGYVFAVASAQPLELRSIRGLFGARSGSGEHVVYGDPYASMQRIARVLVPEWSYVGHAVDWWGYSLGGRYAYPRYACYDAYGSWYYGRGAQYESCDRVRLTLRDDPAYYDARYHRADRRSYADTRGGRDAATVPTYGYKQPARTGDRGTVRPGGTDAAPARTSGGRSQAPERRSEPSRTEGRRTQPSAERPTLQRRGSEGGGERQEPRSAPPPSAPRAEPPPRTQPRAEPAPAPPPGDRADAGLAFGPGSSGNGRAGEGDLAPRTLAGS